MLWFTMILHTLDTKCCDLQWFCIHWIQNVVIYNDFAYIGYQTQWFIMICYEHIILIIVAHWWHQHTSSFVWQTQRLSECYNSRIHSDTSRLRLSLNDLSIVLRSRLLNMLKDFFFYFHNYLFCSFSCAIFMDIFYIKEFLDTLLISVPLLCMVLIVEHTSFLSSFLQLHR